MAIEARSIDWVGMNAYGGMLTVLTAVDSVHAIKPDRRARVLTILGLTVLWFVIAKSISASAVSTVFTSLTLMLYLLVPWTATNLVDFFFVRRGHYAITDLFRVNGIYGAWGRRGLIAYGAGFLLQIPFMVLPDLGGWSYTGFMAKALDGVDIAWIVGLIVSGGVYWGLTRSLDVERERRAEASSERELVAVV
jgi:NCS1 family nucleobase:cation symporter-1